MACEECAKCGIEGTPWEWRKELNGHVCYDCHIELQGNVKHEKASDSDEIE